MEKQPTPAQLRAIAEYIEDTATLLDSAAERILKLKMAGIITNRAPRINPEYLALCQNAFGILANAEILMNYQLDLEGNIEKIIKLTAPIHSLATRMKEAAKKK